MLTTPDFPSWAGGFARQYRRLCVVSAPALHQLESLFGPWIQSFRLAQQEEGVFSRRRRWTFRLVFWAFLWQVAQAGASCRAAVRQVQGACKLLGVPLPPDEHSPYCVARGNLPVDRLDEIHRHLVAEGEAAVASKDLWCGLRVRVVDGTTALAPDTPENQAAFPQYASQKPGCGFPIIRLCGLFSLATGLFLTWTKGNKYADEFTMLHSLWEHLRPGDLLLGDRGFASWAVLAQCLQQGLHGVFRVRGQWRSDWRRGKRLSKNERLVQWHKPRNKPAYLSDALWAALPDVLTLRLVRVYVTQRGHRTRKIILVTTLLDREKYPASALADLYRRRWDMELSLRHLKTTLQMEHLSCKTPNNLDRELWMHFCMHNLVRRLMFESARRAGVPLDRVSFAGSLDAALSYAETLRRARTRRQRLAVIEELYRVLAADLVPDRPGRREPRAVKKRPKSYPRLTFHRKSFRQEQETIHRGHSGQRRTGPKFSTW
jgi:hypothetical protein